MNATDTPAKERILAAALEEFATRGYEASSTNAIASRAGVAKGLVFHYFQNKERLFIELFDHEIERLSQGVFHFGEPMSPDLFTRLHQLTVRKLQLAHEHPLAVDFLLVALTEAPQSLRAELSLKQAALLQKSWPRFLEGIDATGLRPGLSLTDAIETLTALSEGLEKRLTLLLKTKQATLEQVTELAWKHIARLRDGLSVKG